MKILDKEKLKYLLEDDEDLLSEVTREINSYDGSFDFVCTYDLEDICRWNEDVYSLVLSIIYGSVINSNNDVRYDGYGNLETVYESDIKKECLDNIDDIVNWIVDNGVKDIYSIKDYEYDFYDNDYDNEDEE